MCEEHHITKSFRENSSLIEAISTSVDNLEAATDDLLKYSFQYNVKITIGLLKKKSMSLLKIPRKLCLKHSLPNGVTNNDIVMAHS